MQMQFRGGFYMPNIPNFVIVLIIAIAVAVGVLIVLHILGKRMQKKRDEQQAQIDAAAQSFTMLIIDKKKIKLSEAGFPQAVIDQTPKRARNRKVPVVKAKIGPKITPLICEPEIFDLIPVKKTVKGTISGLYLTRVQGMRSSLEHPEKKKNFFQKLMGG